MSKTNVLVFSSATYPAMQVIDCLKNTVRYHIVAASSYPNHSEFICDDSIIDLPFVNEPQFIEKFKKIIKQKNIEYIIPTDETIALFLKENEDQLSAVVTCSPYETTLLCRHKKLAYETVQGKYYAPIVYTLDKVEEIDTFPVFVKPDEGQGAEGAKLVHSLDELLTISNLEDMIISEYLPGEEYTIDCFTNSDRELVYCNPRIRTRLMNGITARGKNVECTDEFKQIILSLNEIIHFRGYWYAQLKRDKDGNLKLLEFCTRFAGSFALSKGRGINLPLLTLCDFEGLPTDVLANDYSVECDKTYIDRYRLGLKYNHIYIDYDDTVTFKDGTAVNPYVIAYLYQCKARSIKITLITRHAATFNEPLEDSFKKLNISKDLFDDIIELNWNQNKIDVMNPTVETIFLDNSFAERKAVKEKYGISVFDISNIDCLFDWRD